MWEGEDDMDVAGREKFSLTCSDPPFPGTGLTLWAVPVPAAVIRDGGAMPATGALIEMTAQSGGAADADVTESFPLL